MTSFSQLKDLYRLQKEAKRVKQELKAIHVEAEGDGVQVVVSGEQEVLSITIAPDARLDRLGAVLTDTLNRALKKAQVVASERMQGLASQMGLSSPQA
jgi:nucleoid-associated protein EbfC